MSFRLCNFYGDQRSNLEESVAVRNDIPGSLILKINVTSLHVSYQPLNLELIINTYKAIPVIGG